MSQAGRMQHGGHLWAVDAGNGIRCRARLMVAQDARLDGLQLPLIKRIGRGSNSVARAGTQLLRHVRRSLCSISG